METVRLFVALNPTEQVRQELAGLLEDIPRVHWTPPERVHLTLRFIGEQSLETQERIEAALANVKVKPFFLDVEGIGGFGDRGNFRVLWVGVGNGHPLLHQLRQRVDDTLLGLGLNLELKPFVPHLTLARCADAPPTMIKHWLKKHREFTGPTWPVSSFALMASEQSRGTIQYRTVKEFALGA